MSTLSSQLKAALASRSSRHIKRSLPALDLDNLVDFTSNDYLSLSKSPILRSHFLQSLQKTADILGSGGSRLLATCSAHQKLENRLTSFFNAPSALLFNSGFEANVGVFSCLPQPGDAIVFDEYIHASVHDGMRTSRAKFRRTFSHNSLSAFRQVISDILHENPEYRIGKGSVFVAVESLYSMDGTFAPLREMVTTLEEMLPLQNGYMIVDEAHATGVYGPSGRGFVSQFGLEDRILVRLHTFGKALAASGAVVLTTPLIKEFLVNYARTLIYTTSLSYSNITQAECAFDMLENGIAAKQAEILQDVLIYFSSTFAKTKIPAHLLSLPVDQPLLSPIIPLFTPHPRPLAAYLYQRGLNARPITWPTVPKGKDRVRVCMHAGTTREEVDRLVNACIAWAEAWTAQENVPIQAKL